MWVDVSCRVFLFLLLRWPVDAVTRMFYPRISERSRPNWKWCSVDPRRFCVCRHTYTLRKTQMPFRTSNMCVFHQCKALENRALGVDLFERISHTHRHMHSSTRNQMHPKRYRVRAKPIIISNTNRSRGKIIIIQITSPQSAEIEY